MLRAALVIVQFYQELAPLLARTHGIAYPDGLERVITSGKGYSSVSLCSGLCAPPPRIVSGVSIHPRRNA